MTTPEGQDRNIAVEIRNRDRLVGFFFTLAFLILVVMLVVNRQQVGEFDTKIGYYTEVSRSYGLKPGADVELSGVVIGKVRDVELQRDGKIRIDLDMFSRYSEFLTTGSYLEVPPVRGVSELLATADIDFVHNSESSVRIEPGSQIDTVEPTVLADTLKELELEQLANRVEVIFDNTEAIVANLQDTTQHWSEQDFSEMITNTNQATARLGDAAESVNELLERMNRIAGQVEDRSDRIPEIMTASEELVRSANELVNQVGDVVTAMNAQSGRVQRILLRSEELLEVTNDLTQKLNNHWLLGGDAPPEEGWSGFRPRNISPYDEAPPADSKESEP